MREHHALGIARRPGAVRQHRQVRGRGEAHLRRGQCPGASRSAALGCPVAACPSPSSTTRSRRPEARPPRPPPWPAPAAAVTVTSILAFESVSCLAMSFGGEQRVDRGRRRAGPQNAVEGDGERRAVGRQQADDVADADAATGQRTRRMRRCGRSSRGRTSPCRTSRRRARPGRGRPRRCRRTGSRRRSSTGCRPRGRGSRNSCASDRTMAAVPVSFVELLDELLGRDHPKRRVDQLCHLVPVHLLLRAVKSSPSQPDGPM